MTSVEIAPESTPPVFLTVKVCRAEVLPVARLPKSRVEGLILRLVKKLL